MRKMSESKARKQFGAKRLRKLCEDGGDPALKKVDWKESVGEVLKEVDAQLVAFDLEVVLHDTGDDNYVWHVENRVVNSDTI